MNKQQFESLCAKVLIPRFADIVRSELIPDVRAIIQNDLNSLRETVDILTDEVVRLNKRATAEEADATPG